MLDLRLLLPIARLDLRLVLQSPAQIEHRPGVSLKKQWSRIRHQRGPRLPYGPTVGVYGRARNLRNKGEYRDKPCSRVRTEATRE
jgi:hypothetical protein